MDVTSDWAASNNRSSSWECSQNVLLCNEVQQLLGSLTFPVTPSVLIWVPHIPNIVGCIVFLHKRLLTLKLYAILWWSPPHTMIYGTDFLGTCSTQCCNRKQSIDCKQKQIAESMRGNYSTESKGQQLCHHRQSQTLLTAYQSLYDIICDVAIKALGPLLCLLDHLDEGFSFARQNSVPENSATW